MPASRPAGSPRRICIRPRRKRPTSRSCPRRWRAREKRLPRKTEPTERTCIVTREQKPIAAMIRFVVAPDGEVVADLRRRLPGRGVWITAKSDLVAKAEKKHL